MIGPTKAAGGMSVHVRELTKGLRAQGSEVVVIQKREGDGPSSATYYLSRVLKDFDIVHVQGLQYFQPLIAALTARKVLGTRAVATAHGFGGESRWWNKKMQRYSMKSILRQFDVLVSISAYVEKRLSLFTGLSPPKVRTIYNGVDTSYFNPSLDATEFRRGIGLEDDFVILYVGRLAWNKGIPDLIKSIQVVSKKVPNAKLLVCGKGRMEGELKKQVEALGLERNVRFTGLVPQEDLPLYYASSDIVAAPSIFEPFGLVLLEALAMGKPVVATNVGGIPEVIKDFETGLLVPPHDSSSIAQAIIRLKEDESLGERLGKRGRELVEGKFSLEKMAEATWSCYKSITRLDQSRSV